MVRRLAAATGGSEPVQRLRWRAAAAVLPVPKPNAMPCRARHQSACVGLPAQYPGNLRSLLCQPLQDEHQRVVGLLLVAHTQSKDLQGLSASLAQLGTFGIAQLHLLQRLHTSGKELSVMPSSPCASGYGLIGDSLHMRAVYQLIGKVL